MAGFNTDGQYGFGKLSGTKKDFNGNHFGWYMGNPDGDTLMMIALGANQNPYDNNALPKYLEDEWSDQNLYWFSPNLPMGSKRFKRIDCNYGPGDIETFAQAQYDTAKGIFPKAENFVVGGYSAGGYPMPGLVKAIQNDDKNVIGIFGVDCVPKDKMYQPFVEMMTSSQAAGIMTFLASSSGSAKSAKSKGKIEQRTEYERQHNPDLADEFETYAGRGVTHENICQNEAFKAAVVRNVNKWMGPYLNHDGMHFAKDGQMDFESYSVALGKDDIEEIPSPTESPTATPAPTPKGVQHEDVMDVPGMSQIKPVSKQLKPLVPKAAEAKVTEAVKQLSKVLTAPKAEQNKDDLKKPSVLKETVSSKFSQKTTEVKGVVAKAATPKVEKPAETVKPARALPDLSNLKVPANKAHALEF